MVGLLRKRLLIEAFQVSHRVSFVFAPMSPLTRYSPKLFMFENILAFWYNDVTGDIFNVNSLPR